MVDFVLYTKSNRPCCTCLSELPCTNIQIDDVYLVSLLGSWAFSYCSWLHSRIYLHNQPWSHDHWNTKVLFALTWAEVFCTCPCILLLDKKHVYKKPVFDLSELYPMHIFFLLLLLCTLCCNKWILAMRITTIESFWWITNWGWSCVP